MIKTRITNELKSWIPDNIKNIIRHYPPFNYSTQFIQWQPKFEQFNVSDYFLFRCDDYETTFIAENNLAITLATPVNCRHMFYFFDENGELCGEYEVDDNGYHFKLNIDETMVNHENLGGFIHQTWYEKELIDKLKSESKQQLIFQHRGYTGFKKRNNSLSIFSFVHGNYGALYVDEAGKRKCLARLAKSHFYTPQYIIKPSSSYEFFFLNPTCQDMEITIILKGDNGDMVKHENVIHAYSPYRYKIEEHSISDECNITWKSNLPICRAIVFENNKHGFDVFHS